MYHYTVTVYTGNVKDAGTDATVRISLYGTAMKTLKENILLTNSSKSLFERGSVDTFTFTDSVKYDAVNYCNVWHDNSGKAPGWYLDKIVIRCQESGKSWVFMAHRWLSKTDGDKRINVFLYIWDHFYNVTIKTGNHKYGGTDAKVYITLHGSNGNSSERLLPASKGDFEVNDEDSFELKTTQDLGQLRSIRLRHDNSGKDPGWFVESVKITCLNDGVIYYLPVQRWFSKEDDDKKISRIIYVASNSLGQRYRFFDKRALVLQYAAKGDYAKDIRNEAKKMENMFTKKNVPVVSLTGMAKSTLVTKISNWGKNAKDDSMSFISIHCHGNDDGTLYVLNDPNLGYGLSLQDLKAMLDQVRGVKVLFIEACYGGNAIELRSLTPKKKTGEDAILQVVENVFFPKKTIALRSGEFRVNNYHVFCSTTATALSPGIYQIASIWAAGCNSLHPATVQKLQNYAVKQADNYYKWHQWASHLRPQMWSPNPDVILFD